MFEIRSNLVFAFATLSFWLAAPGVAPSIPWGATGAGEYFSFACVEVALATVVMAASVLAMRPATVRSLVVKATALLVVLSIAEALYWIATNGVEYHVITRFMQGEWCSPLALLVALIGLEYKKLGLGGAWSISKTLSASVLIFCIGLLLAFAGYVAKHQLVDDLYDMFASIEGNLFATVVAICLGTFLLAIPQRSVRGDTAQG